VTKRNPFGPGFK